MAGWTAADLDTHYPRRLTGVWDAYVIRAEYLAGQISFSVAQNRLIEEHQVDQLAAQAMLARPMSAIRVKNYIGVDVDEQQIHARNLEALNA
jgi:hypothetical protein